MNFPSWTTFGKRGAHSKRRSSASVLKKQAPNKGATGAATQETVTLPTFDGPGAWKGPDMMANPESWTTQLSDDEIAEIDTALANAESLGIDIIDLSPKNFPLPTLGPKLRAVRDELVNGRGFALWKGLPVKRWSKWQVCACFYAMGTHMGWTISQNAKGHVLGHVKDLGNDPDDPSTRIYTTSAAQPYHTDSADIVGLLCINKAVKGGESQCVSSLSIWNELVAARPDLAAVLEQPFIVDRKGEVPPGKLPTYDMPIFHRHDSGHLSAIYDRSFIDAAQKRDPTLPRLTAEQTEALDTLDALACSDSLRLDMKLEPGDVQFLHNHTTLHARSAYEDGGAPENRRHLLRLWISPPNARPLPSVFAERFGTIEVGPARGGINVDGQSLYCALDAE